MTIDENLELTKAIAEYRELKLKQIDDNIQDEIIKEALKMQVRFCCLDFGHILFEHTFVVKEVV